MITSPPPSGMVLQGIDFAAVSHFCALSKSDFLNKKLSVLRDRAQCKGDVHRQIHYAGCVGDGLRMIKWPSLRFDVNCQKGCNSRKTPAPLIKRWTTGAAAVPASNRLANRSCDTSMPTSSGTK